jgi:hypothetical protein
MLYSDDMSLEGLQQELEECKNDDVSTLFLNASGCNNFIHVTYWKKMVYYVLFRGLHIDDSLPTPLASFLM